MSWPPTAGIQHCALQYPTYLIASCSVRLVYHVCHTTSLTNTDCFQYSTRSACAPGRILKANCVCVSGSRVSPCDGNEKQEAWRRVILKAGLAVSRHTIVVSQTNPIHVCYDTGYESTGIIYIDIFWCQEMKLEESEKSGRLLTYNHQVSSSLRIILPINCTMASGAFVTHLLSELVSRKENSWNDPCRGFLYSTNLTCKTIMVAP